MTDAPTAVAIATAPPRPRWLDWVPALAFLMVLLTALLAGGGYIEQIKQNTQRIEKLEAKDELLRQVDLRTARIEAKLEILTARRELRP